MKFIQNESVLMSLSRAALKAVAPDAAVLRHLKLSCEILSVTDAQGNELAYYDLDKVRRIVVLGAGKAVAPMGRAVESVLGNRVETGMLVVPYGHGLKLNRIHVVEGAHPVPDEAGQLGAAGILRLASGLEAGDLAICLFGGGASALTPALAPGIALSELQDLTNKLLLSGADIHAINTVRKHLSAFGGGRLAQAIGNARALNLVVSDVAGDDLGVIASGPLAPDPTTYSDSLAVLERFGLRGSVSATLVDHLVRGQIGKLPETPKPGDPLFDNVFTCIVASLAQALDAAGETAAEMGYELRRIGVRIRGEARVEAKKLVEKALMMRSELSPGDKPLCILAGGESTVRVLGKGKGGRNQEMALATLLELEDTVGIQAVFFGTDGRDGPTDAAGGFAASGMLKELRSRGLNPEKALDDNDSYTFLEEAGLLLRTGPTMTNVMDLAVLLVQPPEQ